MRVSGLLGNSIAIASLGGALESQQLILYFCLERLAAKFFDHPTQPAWRESEVSAKLHATGGSVNGCGGDGGIVDGAQWQGNMQLDLVLFRIHSLYPESHIPGPAKRRGFCIDHLPGRGL